MMAGMAARPKSSFNRGMQYAHIGFAIPAATIAGWLLGALLDRLFHTHWIYLVGLLLGVVAGFYDIIRAVQQMNKENYPQPGSQQQETDDE
jgi:F0F1-type ATP synthase assembly protein I